MGKGKHRRAKTPEATGAKAVGKAVVGLVSSVAVAGGASAALADGAAKGRASDTQYSRADAAYADSEPSEYRTSDIAPHGVVDQVVHGGGSAQPTKQNCDASAKSTQQLIKELSPECQNSTAERAAAAQELGNRGTFVSDQKTNRLFFQPMTVASDRINEARAMSTQELINRLSPESDVSQDQRTAAFLGLQDRGFQIFDPQTNDLHFNPQMLVDGDPGDQSTLASGSQLPVSAASGSNQVGVTEAPSTNQVGVTETPSTNQGAVSQAPSSDQVAVSQAPSSNQVAVSQAPVTKAAAPQQSEGLLGGRIEIPTSKNSFVFVQAGANSKTLSISGGGGVGVGGNRSFVGVFNAPPTGINLRGDVSLTSPTASVKGEARVNFNPVTREFSGGGSGEVQLNGAGGSAVSNKVSLDVKPDGEIKLTTTQGEQVDLGGRKLSVDASQPSTDGTQSAPSFKVGLSGGPLEAAGSQGFKAEGRFEADATANVPLDSLQNTSGASTPSDFTAMGDYTGGSPNNNTNAETDATANTPSDTPQTTPDASTPNDFTAMGDYTGGSPNNNTNTETDATANTPSDTPQTTPDASTPNDFTAMGDYTGGSPNNSGDFSSSSNSRSIDGASDLSGGSDTGSGSSDIGSGDFSGSSDLGDGSSDFGGSSDLGGDGSSDLGGSDFDSGASDFSGGSDFDGSSDLGGSDFDSGASDFSGGSDFGGGSDLGGGDFGGGGF
ncbi:hypothetical protein [Streptomyces marispadix]|uniref:Uncharacterized protein n=1 Tax=Streptomyces marispadix TaxID=2922868 RepID=A0ABS9SUK1_9ACTN|nr:hypothetical protein [Streptomyces marispadix]MCH6159949.1 hypothetical protein [Streptomyces marispadix]